MKLGIVGLGRMGGNIALRLMDRGHECVVWDRDAKAVAAAQAGAVKASGLANLVKKLPAPRAVWVMLPAGAPTEDTIAELAKLLSKGDIVIDGGNTLYKDDIRRAGELARRGIEYIDIGTSGGVWGRERGYCLMVGGNKKAVKILEPVLSALAPGAGEIARTVGRTVGRTGKASSAEQGWLHCGPAGAGHFVKMIHNGIEYGMMQAYAEGFDILKGRASSDLPAAARYDLDLAEIAELWRRGSVITSWLLDLSASALAQDAELSDFSGAVADSGEGRWTIDAAVEEAVPAPVLAASLFARFRSRRDNSFADRVLSAMRRGFGGHVEKSKKRA